MPPKKRLRTSSSAQIIDLSGLDSVHSNSITSSRTSQSRSHDQQPSTMFPHSEVVIVESISKKTRAEDSAVVLVGERANYVPRRSQIPRVSALEPNYLIQRDAELRSVTHRAPENRQVLDADEAFARSLQEAEYHALQPAQLQLSQIDQLRRLIMDPYQLASLLGGQHNPANYLDDEEDMSYEALLALGDRIGNVKQNKSDNATIQSLPTRKCPTSDMSCAVCLDDFKKNQNQRGLPCDHWFHLKCINKWLKNSTWCPICRKSVQ